MPNFVVQDEEEEDCVTEHCAEDKVDDLVIFEPIDLDGNLVGLEEASGDADNEARAQAERDLAEMDSSLTDLGPPAETEPVGQEAAEHVEEEDLRVRDSGEEGQTEYTEEMSNDIEALP